METIEQIKIDEGGYQAEVYLCSEGKLTWLYGRNIEERPITNIEWSALKLTIRMGGCQFFWANNLFDEEIRNLWLGLEERYFVTMSSVPSEVRNIILNMAYNMGLTKFNPKKWPKFFQSINLYDWKQASIEGRDSKWFNQVGQRSVRLMNSLEKVK